MGHFLDSNGYSLIYDIVSETFSKMVMSENPMIIPSQHINTDLFLSTLSGLNEFIGYLENVHHKYLNDIVRIGWDATKTANGDWIVVECNAWAGYYYSDR